MRCWLRVGNVGCGVRRKRLRERRSWSWMSWTSGDHPSGGQRRCAFLGDMLRGGGRKAWNVRV